MNSLEEIVKKASGRGKPGEEPKIPRGDSQNFNHENANYRYGFNDGFTQGFIDGIKKCKRRI